MHKVKERTDDRAYKTNYDFYGILGIVTYFIWCDFSFFGELSADKNKHVLHGNTTLLSKITIKLRMQDHFTHYIYLPFCVWLDETFKISKIPFVTPNVITAIHFCFVMVACRLLASRKLTVRRIGVLLYEIRSMLDVLDGVIFRAQSTEKEYLSGWGTYGYLIDASADTIGALIAMVATIYRFNRYSPLKDPGAVAKLESRFENTDEESGERFLSSDDSRGGVVVETYGSKRYSKKAVNLTLLFYTIIIVVRMALWDHFNHAYHELLGVKRIDIAPEKQIEMLGYGSTWFCLWLWTVHSADAFMHFTALAIFFGKLWKWIRFNLYAFIPNIVIVSLICQINLIQMRNLLGVSH